MADFRESLLSDDEIVRRLNEGAMSKNEYNALKYIEKIIEYKGLGRGIGNLVRVDIPGLTDIDDSLPFEVEESEIRESREDIESFLYD
jgi:hypothetical protein